MTTTVAVNSTEVVFSMAGVELTDGEMGTTRVLVEDSELIRDDRTPVIDVDGVG